MHSSTRYDHMEREELVRLAGEQALLKQEMAALSAEQQRDLLALRNLADVAAAAYAHAQKGAIDWHARGVQLLDRMRDRQQRAADGQRRLAEFSKLTGIS